MWNPTAAYLQAHPGDALFANTAFATQEDVHGSFPADFSLSLFTTPPPAVEDLWYGSDVYFASGRLVAIDPTKVLDHDDGTVDVSNAIVGSTDSVDASLDATQYQIWDFSSSYPGAGAGYHLMQVTSALGPCPTAAQAATCMSNDDQAGYPQTGFWATVCSERPVVFPIVFTEVPITTSLTLTLSDTFFFAADPTTGIYPGADAPACTQ